MDERNRSRKRWWIGSSVVLAVLLIGAGVMVFRPRPVKIITATVQRQTLQNKIFATGTVKPLTRQILMPTQLTSPIEKIAVQVNQQVHAGAVLVTLQNEAQSATLNAASVAVQQSRAALQQAQQEQAAAPIGMQPQFEGTVAAAQLSLSQAQSGLAQAQAAYDATVIKAKMDGTVILVNSEGVGADGTPAPILEVAAAEKQIVTSVSEVDAVHVQRGMEATVTSEAYPDKTWTAKVSRVAEFASSGASGTGQVEIDLTVGSTFDVAFGYDVDVHIVTNTHKEVPVVPYAALTQDGGNSYVVYVYQNGRVHRVEVTLGITTDNLVEVTKGLQSNQVVVLNPPSSMRDGEAVTNS